MNTTHPLSFKFTALGLALTAMLTAQAATTDLATSPLITSSSTSVLPNVFLILDDSGSMGWDYMPDNASNFNSGTYGAASSQCNGVFYNPNIRYIPPVYSTGASYLDSSFTAAWKDGYKTASGSTNLSTSFVSPGGDPAQAAFYYTYTGTQTTEALKNYYDTASTFYRECNSPVSSSPTATITVAGSTSTSVTQITVDGTTITSGSTTSTNKARDVATNIAAKITAAGYSATSSSTVVTIVGPSGSVGLTPVVTASPATGMTFTTTSFITAPFTKVTVGSASGAGTFDLNGDGVVDASDKDERVNFANWYSYYRTRMLTMKTSTGLAFKPIGDNYRVGYSSINNNTTSDYLGLSKFDATQKSLWYDKLYAAATGSSTPLREALSNVGKMYADQLTTLNGATVVDPIQYACQQNFTILTTDGFWNGNAGTKLDGTAIGNQDGNDVRPMYDGAVQSQSTSQNLQTDTQLTVTTTQLQQWTQQLQSQTSSLQKRTGTLQWQTNQQQTTATLKWKTDLYKTTADLQWQTNLQRDSGTLASWTDQMEVKAPLQWATKQQVATAALQWQTNLEETTGTLQKRTSQLQTQTTQLQKSTSQLQQQISQLQSSTSTLQQSTMYLQTQTSSNSGATWGNWTSTASCTWDTNGGSRRNCRYAIGTGSGGTAWSAAAATWSNAAGTCTISFSTGTTNGTNWSGNGRNCRYSAWSAPANVTTCTNVAQSAGPTTFSVLTARQCTTAISTPYTNVASCTTVTTPDVNGQTTQCQYTGWSAWAGASSCVAQAQSGASPYTVGTATQCRSVVTSAYANTSACTPTTVPNASGNTTQCQYLGWSGWANVGAGGTCTPVSQATFTGPATECQLTGITSGYVTTNPPTCSVTYNAVGTSTADANGKSTTACFNSGATYSALQNVGAGGTCTSGAITTGTGGGSVQCVMAAATPAYVTSYPPTCSTSYSAGGTSTADASGNVSVCSTAGAFSTPAPVGAGGACAASANVQCSTGAALPAQYVTNYPVPSCSITYNAGGTSTADASGYVVTGCPTTTWAQALADNPAGTGVASCDWMAPTASNPHQWCNVINISPSYITTFPPVCATATVSGTGYITADADGRVTVSCTNNGATYSAAQPVPANATCTGGPIAIGAGGGTVHCVTGPNDLPVAITTYPPTCTTTYNGATGTSTANGTKVVTACGTGAWTAGTAVNAASAYTCNAALPNVQCDASTGLATTDITTYPPTCTINFNAAGTSTADAGGKVVTACPTGGAPVWRNTVAGGSCTPGANVNCQYAWGAWSNAASCTTNFSSGAGAWSITSGTDCQYAVFTPWADLAATSCTTVAQSAASPYTVGTARDCRTINVTTPANTPANPAEAWVATGSCTATTPAGTFDNTGKQIQCKTVTSAPAPIASCTPGTVPASSGNSWTSTTCANNILQLNAPVLTCTAALPTAGNNFVKTTCPAPLTTGPTTVAGCVPSSPTAANNWTTTTCAVVSGGTTDTLADVAEYYYLTDLRTVALGNNLSGAGGAVNGTDVSANIVPKGGADTAVHQHMTTFTLGLGARGKMVFDPSYQSAISGDFYAVKTGATANGSTVCPWQTGGACNWPVPGDSQIENIDDLWHTAVNGRGTYFSAADPSGLALGMSNALSGVSARLGAASAATTSTAFITEGDNFLFHSSYVSQEWTGDLVRYQIDPVTGVVGGTADWSAQAQLDAVADYTTRKIYFNKSGVLAPFVYGNLNPAQQASFALGNLLTLAQFCSVGGTCLSAADQSLAAGANLVNYIRGEKVHAGALADNTKYYRERKHQLGDLVDSESVYVKKPTAGYTDPGYSGFRTVVSGRTAMVYIGGNDGMLHAFDATTGDEVWAYIPSMVIPNLHHLADKNYGPLHQFYVDASPVVGDVCVSGCGGSPVWKTILVGGLGGGGKGYYALDITDPANPQLLWEFTNANLGYTYGNPYMVKLIDGTWVVVVTSGYNNTTGDGMGHLYVLNAGTGAIIHDISTGVGSPASPSGLSRISIPVEQPGYDATAMAVYGGDLEGNLWRFDINGNRGAAGYDAQLMATLRDSSGNVQPITAKPTVGASGTTLIVYVGTGRYLGLSDIADTSQQSFYAMKDTFPTGTTPSVALWGNPRTQGSFVQQTMTIGSCPVGAPAAVCSPGDTVQKVSKNPVDLAVNGGWYIDFPTLGERNNTDPTISKGTVILTTNLPSLSSCEVGGRSFLYQLDYLSGSAGGIAGPSGVGGIGLGNELASRPVTAQLSDGTVKIYVQGSTGTLETHSGVGKPPVSGTVRGVSWRELVQ